MNGYDINVLRTRASLLCLNQSHPNFNVIITCSRLITATKETRVRKAGNTPTRGPSFNAVLKVSRYSFQGASLRCLALPPGTRPNCSWAPSFLPRSITSLPGPPTWDFGHTAAGLLPSFQRVLPCCLGPPTWDSAKLQLGSFLPTKEHRLAAWPSHLGLGQTVAGLLPFYQGASPLCLALPPGTRPYCSWAPSFLPRSNASLLGPPTWDSTKLQLSSSLASFFPHITLTLCCKIIINISNLLTSNRSSRRLTADLIWRSSGAADIINSKKKVSGNYHSKLLRFKPIVDIDDDFETDF
ncbi:Ethylene-responsive transcription factor RAP2-12 [Abeliophyllum distichum]|uniref:Ethylene-responsive transcription factor RAP2-12 n=1 Tax=Abeliophyllum distichum TaxID=126358 RepID=A0ABD1TKV4_9LAMI